jgi:subtilase family serine protease
METNNTRASAAMKVGPDLIISALTVPATGAAGTSLSVTDSTKNQGLGPAPSSSTGFYLSANSTFEPTDTFLGNRAVGALAADGIESATTPLPIPAGLAPGTYFVLARADWNVAVTETIETNNDRLSAAIRIGPDLVVTSVLASATGMANGTISVTDTTKNQGGVAVPETSTGFYLSTTVTLSAAATFIGSRTVGALGVLGAESGTSQLVVPAGTAPGVYYVIGVADWNGAVLESLENNNTRNSGTIRIGPDLTVSALTAPTSAVAGATISGSETTVNQGGEATPASITKFYLSTNATLDGADPLIGTRSLPSIAPGLSNTGPASLAIPASTTAGTYYIIAKADGDDAILEVSESNNVRTKTISISTAP